MNNSLILLIRAILIPLAAAAGMHIGNVEQQLGYFPTILTLKLFVAFLVTLVILAYIDIKLSQRKHNSKT